MTEIRQDHSVIYRMQYFRQEKPFTFGFKCHEQAIWLLKDIYI